MRIKIGDRVEKTGSIKDYTVGRQGEVIEIDHVSERAHVSWDHSPVLTEDDNRKVIRAGFVKPMQKPIRTWVNLKYLSDPL